MSNYLMRVRQHLGYYIAFTLVQILGLIVVLLAAGDRQMQLIAILATTFFYFIFAVAHHFLNHDLNAKIVLEYALMGCLGLTVSLVLFNK